MSQVPLQGIVVKGSSLNISSEDAEGEDKPR